MNIFKKALLLLTLTTLVASGILTLLPSKASAFTPNYNPSNLIDDNVFADKNSMGLDSIRSFLKSVNSNLVNYEVTENCGSKTGAHYAFYKAHYDCGVRHTAAKIIYDAAHAYSISPRSIIATIQKEQSLITTPPGQATSYQRDFAMGYACPDSGGCGSVKGFFGQVDNGAWQFRYDIEGIRHHTSWNGWSGMSSWYSSACGHSTGFYSAGLYPGNRVTFYSTSGHPNKTISIANASTAALYCYTPHVGPYSQTGYSGSYNFVYYFDLWWGTTYGYTKLDTPRWMVLTTSTPAIDPFTGQPADQSPTSLPQGTQLKFADKVEVNGQWYLRPASNSAQHVDRTIPMADLGEISYQPFDTPRYMHLASNTYKVNPRTGKHSVSTVFKEGQDIFFSDKIEVNGQWYYRTTYDHNQGSDSTIPASKVEDIAYTSFKEPRYMNVTSAVTKLNPVTSETSSTTISKGTQVKFSSKITVDGTSYYRTASDTTNGVELAVSSSSVSDIPYVNVSDRWLQLNTAAAKTNPRSGVTTSASLPTGTQAKVAQKITVNGVTYYRTTYDISHNLDNGIPVGDFEEIPYTAIATPEWLQLKVSARKVSPHTDAVMSSLISKGTQFKAVQKITVNGVLYYKTDYDVNHSIDEAFPASKVENIPYVSLDKPRELSINKNTTKYVPSTGVATSVSLTKDQQIYFSSKVRVNGQWYLRTQHDTTDHLNMGVLQSDVNL
jgi:hypothetical protein